MIEWIVLIFMAGNPQTYRVGISSTTEDFNRTWNSLTISERETARVFKGSEFAVNPTLTKKMIPLENKMKYCNNHLDSKLYENIAGKWICPISRVEIEFPIEK